MTGTSARPSRRTLLGAAALAPLAACTAGAVDPGPAPLPPVDPDVALREQALAREGALLAAYDAAIAATPALASRLSPLRAEHAAHVVALQEPAAELTPPPPTTPVAVPRQSTATLVAAERAAARAHALGARTASPALAQVLASLAASEASHEIALAT